MVGAGGCQLFKTFALSGFQDIRIVNFSPFYHAYVLFFDRVDASCLLCQWCIYLHILSEKIMMMYAILSLPLTQASGNWIWVWLIWIWLIIMAFCWSALTSQPCNRFLRMVPIFNGARCWSLKFQLGLQRRKCN